MRDVVGNALKNIQHEIGAFCLWQFLFFLSPLFGQVIRKCDGTVLLMVSKNVGKLNQDQIRDFLLTFGRECRINVGYSEWSNELLFSILEKQTDLILKTIEREKKKIDIEEIFEDLSSPVHDMPVKVMTAKNLYAFIYPTKDWKELDLKDMQIKDFKVDTDNFYIDVRRD